MIKLVASVFFCCFAALVVGANFALNNLTDLPKTHSPLFVWATAFSYVTLACMGMAIGGILWQWRRRIWAFTRHPLTAFATTCVAAKCQAQKYWHTKAIGVAVAVGGGFAVGVGGAFALTTSWWHPVTDAAGATLFHLPIWWKWGLAFVGVMLTLGTVNVLFPPGAREVWQKIAAPWKVLFACTEFVRRWLWTLGVLSTLGVACLWMLHAMGVVQAEELAQFLFAEELQTLLDHLRSVGEWVRVPSPQG